jgi:guanine nucleotide-binding protein subunit alpha
MKQMKVLYANPYTEEERTLYRLTVFRNLIDSVQALIKAMYSFDLKPMTQENQEYSSFLLEYRLNPNPKTLLDTKVGDAISSLWKDEVIPKVMERQKEFYLMDPAP